MSTGSSFVAMKSLSLRVSSSFDRLPWPISPSDTPDPFWKSVSASLPSLSYSKSSLFHSKRSSWAFAYDTLSSIRPPSISPTTSVPETREYFSWSFYGSVVLTICRAILIKLSVVSPSTRREESTNRLYWMEFGLKNRRSRARRDISDLAMSCLCFKMI